ncbi:MAG: bile acid:sodium symporter family protein [Cytophagaceae bacterium]
MNFIILFLFLFLSILVPDYFKAISPYLSYLLAMVMITMGISTTWESIIDSSKQWKWILLGTILQFLIMPLTAYLLSIAFQLPQEYLIGMIIVGTCPGGTASNVMVYLFKGNVTLSIILTLISTLLSVFLTPWLLEVYLGSTIDIPVQKLMFDILFIVIIPVLTGLILQWKLPSTIIEGINKNSGTLAMIVISIIIACIYANSNLTLSTLPYLLVLAVILHNSIGMASGYFITLFLSKNKSIARTIAIEVGMQNSGLGAILAKTHFTIGSSLPSAIFSIWHNISGSLMVEFWKKK